MMMIVNDVNSRKSENSKSIILKSLYETKSFYNREIIDDMNFNRGFIEEELFFIYLDHLKVGHYENT